VNVAEVGASRPDQFRCKETAARRRHQHTENALMLSVPNGGDLLGAYAPDDHANRRAHLRWLRVNAQGQVHLSQKSLAIFAGRKRDG